MLLAIRVERHWSQRQLGQALGVSRRTVIRWEQSETEPSVLDMARIRALFEGKRGEAA
jgi:transcriptional regulator with XRE-family HTH domain